MDGDTLHSIGDLARRTGLTVKAIRFYSDRGIVPPTELAVINSWPVPESLAPVLDWFVRALRARIPA